MESGRGTLRGSRLASIGGGTLNRRRAGRGSRRGSRVTGGSQTGNFHGSRITARGSSAAGIVGGGVGWKSNGKLPNRRRGTSTGKQTDETLARFGRDRSGSGRARRVEVKRETSKPAAGNVQRRSNRRNFSAVRGSRIADRSRFDSRRQSWIGNSGSDRGGSRPDRQTFNRFSQSWIADRGSRYVSTGGREAGRGMFHFLKDTKNPALGGVDRIGFIDQT